MKQTFQSWHIQFSLRISNSHRHVKKSTAHRPSTRNLLSSPSQHIYTKHWTHILQLVSGTLEGFSLFCLTGGRPTVFWCSLWKSPSKRREENRRQASCYKKIQAKKHLKKRSNSSTFLGVYKAQQKKCMILFSLVLRAFIKGDDIKWTRWRTPQQSLGRETERKKVPTVFFQRESDDLKFVLKNEKTNCIHESLSAWPHQLRTASTANTPLTLDQEVFIKKLLPLQPHFPRSTQSNVNRPRRNASTTQGQVARHTVLQISLLQISRMNYIFEWNVDAKTNLQNRSEGPEAIFYNL